MKLKLLQFLIVLSALWLYSGFASASTINKPPDSLSLIKGLVGHWSFDANDMAGERAYDRSGNSNTGTLTNGPVRAIGKLGQALSFDGSDDNVSLPQAPFKIQILTLSAWIYIRDINQNPIFGFANSVYYNGYDFYVDSTTPTVRFITTGSGGAAMDNIVSTTVLNQNTWYHVAVTAGGAGQPINLYVNGVLEATDASQSTLVFDATMYPMIGQDTIRADYKDNANGLIDEVRVYNRALSAEEIKRLYNIGATLKINKPLNTGSLSNGLVGHWTFDGKDMAGERAYDLSGNSNTGTLTNGPVRTIGKIGQALSFDNNNDIVEITDNDSLSPSQFTLTAWIKWDGQRNASGSDKDWGAIISKGTYASGEYTILMNHDSAQTNTDLNLYINGTLPLTWSNSSIDRNWHSVAATFNGSVVKLYFDGLERASANAAPTVPNSTNTLGIGRQTGSGQYPWGGLIDDARVYNRALSPEEVKRLYNIGATLKINKPLNTGSLSNGLVGHWTFDGKDMAGERAYDLSGNSNTGTLTNGPVRAIGKLGQALSFDGRSSVYVDVGDPSSGALDFGTGSFSYGSWFKSNESGGDFIINKRASSGVLGYDLLLAVGSVPGNIVGRLEGSIQSSTWSGTNDGRWHHVMIVVDRSAQVIKIYGDGIQRGSNVSISALGSLSNATSFQIGARVGVGSLTGLIDDVRVYNRALSPEEVRRLYNMGR